MPKPPAALLELTSLVVPSAKYSLANAHWVKPNHITNNSMLHTLIRNILEGGAQIVELHSPSSELHKVLQYQLKLLFGNHDTLEF